MRNFRNIVGQRIFDEPNINKECRSVCKHQGIELFLNILIPLTPFSRFYPQSALPSPKPQSRTKLSIFRISHSHPRSPPSASHWHGRLDTTLPEVLHCVVVSRLLHISSRFEDMSISKCKDYQKERRLRKSQRTRHQNLSPSKSTTRTKPASC